MTSCGTRKLLQEVHRIRLDTLQLHLATQPSDFGQWLKDKSCRNQSCCLATKTEWIDWAFTRQDGIYSQLLTITRGGSGTWKGSVRSWFRQVIPRVSTLMPFIPMAHFSSPVIFQGSEWYGISVLERESCHFQDTMPKASSQQISQRTVFSL